MSTAIFSGIADKEDRLRSLNEFLRARGLNESYRDYRVFLSREDRIMLQARENLLSQPQRILNTLSEACSWYPYITEYDLESQHAVAPAGDWFAKLFIFSPNILPLAQGKLSLERANIIRSSAVVGPPDQHCPVSQERGYRVAGDVYMESGLYHDSGQWAAVLYVRTYTRATLDTIGLNTISQMHIQAVSVFNSGHRIYRYHRLNVHENFNGLLPQVRGDPLLNYQRLQLDMEGFWPRHIVYDHLQWLHDKHEAETSGSSQKWKCIRRGRIV
ncbi:hypothetical protein GGR57DRAFT_504776 [Xylariaceae sp. FL1272]|nr:hypothetical protein GGR57DRAFT_504776 [Xylariaceae sp. FL1272]